MIFILYPSHREKPSVAMYHEEFEPSMSIEYNQITLDWITVLQKYNAVDFKHIVNLLNTLDTLFYEY